MTVVQDTAALIALYIAPGTRFKHPRLPDGRLVSDTLIDDWLLIDQVWTGGGALYLSTPDAPYALMLFWSEGHVAFEGWYINVQEPYRRTARGFDYLDLELDLVIKPDRRQWRWKDEDSFSKLQQYGRLSEARAGVLRAEAERLLAQIQTDQPFFGSGWERWSPPAGWTIPRLPRTWDMPGT